MILGNLLDRYDHPEPMSRKGNRVSTMGGPPSVCSAPVLTGWLERSERPLNRRKETPEAGLKSVGDRQLVLTPKRPGRLRPPNANIGIINTTNSPAVMKNAKKIFTVV